MIERAIAALKANEAAALKAFNDEKNKEFRDRDLYVYCFSLPDGNITAYQSPVMVGTNVKELKLPPNNPVGQRAYDAVAKAAEGEIVSFTYDFPKPGTKAPVPKETLEARIGKQARARANSVSAVPFWYPLKPEGFNLLLTKPRPSMKPLNTRGSSMDQALMVRIRERAYHIWEESGGHADDNWLQAETEILQLGMPPTSLPSIPKEQRSRSNRVRAPGTGTKRFLSRAAL